MILVCDRVQICENVHPGLLTAMPSKMSMAVWYMTVPPVSSENTRGRNSQMSSNNWQHAVEYRMVDMGHLGHPIAKHSRRDGETNASWDLEERRRNQKHIASSFISGVDVQGVYGTKWTLVPGVNTCLILYIKHYIYMFVEDIGKHRTCMANFQLVKWTSRVLKMQKLFTLPETKVAPEMDDWNTNSLSGFRVFRSYASSRECSRIQYSNPSVFVLRILRKNPCRNLFFWIPRLFWNWSVFCYDSRPSEKGDQMYWFDKRQPGWAPPTYLTLGWCVGTGPFGLNPYGWNTLWIIPETYRCKMLLSASLWLNYNLDTYKCKHDNAMITCLWRN